MVNLASQLTSWNPYDQNNHSEFFDPEWMFGLQSVNNGYFNIVIGNPPYISAISQDRELRTKLANSKDYSTLYQKWDIYVAFIEKGIRLTNKGINCMIIPYPVTNQMYAQKLRDFILNENDLIEITNLSGNKIFEEATVTNCIFFVKNGRSENNKVRISKLVDKSILVSDIVLKTDMVQDENSCVWNISNNDTIGFIDENFKTVGDFCYISVGMVLNADEKKAKGLFVKDDLLSLYETNINKRRYIEAKHIDKHIIKDNLFLEWGTSRVPSLIRRPTFPELYERPKLIVSKIGKIKATYDNSNIYCDQTIRILILWHDLENIKNKSIDSTVKRYHSDNRNTLEQNSKQMNLKYLLGILNTKLANFLLDQIRGIGNIDINPEYIRNIPIPITQTGAQLKIADIVDKILVAKAEDPNSDTGILEEQIDNLVYRLYNLTYKEVKGIDPEIVSKINEMEYNSIEI